MMGVLRERRGARTSVFWTCTWTRRRHIERERAAQHVRAAHKCLHARCLFYVVVSIVPTETKVLENARERESVRARGICTSDRHHTKHAAHT